MGSDIGAGMSEPVYVIGGGSQGIQSLTPVALVFKPRDYPKATQRILGIFGWVSKIQGDRRYLYTSLCWLLGCYLIPITRFSSAVGGAPGAIIVDIEQISEHESTRYVVFRGRLKNRKELPL